MSDARKYKRSRSAWELAGRQHGVVALWGIGKERRGRIDVSVRRRSELERPGLRVRARAKLDPAKIAAKDGIPVTEPGVPGDPLPPDRFCRGAFFSQTRDVRRDRTHALLQARLD